MLNLNDLHYFVASVEAGGFAAASRQLCVPKSTLSKRVACLETELQARLIQRSSRSFRLTDAGEAFYDHARASLIEAEAAEAAVRERSVGPSGRVSITMSVPTAQLYFAEHLPRLAQKYPKLQLKLEVTDRFVDLVRDGFDIAIRSHFTPLPDSGLIQRRLRQESFILTASPVYLEGRDIQTPSDLDAQDGLMMGPSALSWNLSGPDGVSYRATPRPRLFANETTLLLESACAGLGIVCLPDSHCRQALHAGKLQHVLPGWTAGHVTTTLLMPHRRGQLPGVRAAVDFLVNCLA